MSEHHHDALPAGHRIDEYEIVRVLGAGGFGITYVAFDHELDGPVALKEYFPAEVATREGGSRVVAVSSEQQAVFAWGLDRFVGEARSIHRFRHPNVVRAHRYLKTHGTAYIVMEYVEGESLEGILNAHGPLSPDGWRRRLDPLLDGLAHVHGHGYLHRDIKPANVVIRASDGEPVLIDFGSARLAARERTLTQVMTPGYAPIEQYSDAGVQGPPTDIYALAAVSYRVLTGQRVASAPDRVLRDEYRPLAKHVGGVDRHWLAEIDRGLALRPEDRPQAVGTWRAALRKKVGAATGGRRGARSGAARPGKVDALAKKREERDAAREAYYREQLKQAMAKAAAEKDRRAALPAAHRWALASKEFMESRSTVEWMNVPCFVSIASLVFFEVGPSDELFFLYYFLIPLYLLILWRLGARDG